MDEGHMIGKSGFSFLCYLSYGKNNIFNIGAEFMAMTIARLILFTFNLS